MDKEEEIDKKMVERLQRIFSNLVMYEEAHYFTETDLVPPVNMNWYDIINKLQENGLTIGGYVPTGKDER